MAVTASQPAGIENQVGRAAPPTDPAERVYRGILDAIYSGELFPGQRLVESDLSEKFDAGRSYVREALQRLENDGAITIVPFRGARIRTFSPSEVRNIGLIQATLFALACKTAALNIDEADNRRRLQDAMDHVERFNDMADYYDYIMARENFLRVVIAISGIHEIERIAMIVQSQLIRRQNWAQYTRAHHDRRIVHFRAMHAALMAGDPNASERAVWASADALAREDALTDR